MRWALLFAFPRGNRDLAHAAAVPIERSRVRIKRAAGDSSAGGQHRWAVSRILDNDDIAESRLYRATDFE